MKNIEKSILLLSLLCLLTVTYGIAFALRAMCYYQKLWEMPMSHPELGQTIYDFPKSFLRMPEGVLWTLGIIPLTAAWLLLLWFRAPKSPRIAPLVGLLCIATCMATLIPTCHLTAETVQPATYDYSLIVDVLCAGDEEFMENADANKNEAEEMIAKANSWTSISCPGCFELTFGLHFEVAGWVSWDSDDSVHHPQWMAAEAWTETGFEEGTEYNGVILDMLSLFTGQYIDGFDAVCFPDANISMFDWGLLMIPCFYTGYGVIRHEYSHQFYCPECTHACVMNRACLKDLCLITPPGCWDVDWCTDCETWINNHKHKWQQDDEYDGFGGGSSARLEAGRMTMTTCFY